MEGSFVVKHKEVSVVSANLDAIRLLPGVESADYATVGTEGLNEDGGQNVRRTWDIIVHLTDEADAEDLEGRIRGMRGVEHVTAW